MGATAAVESSRTIRAAIRRLPAANLALISVPGDFAVAEAHKALEFGLHAMIFSDNVPIADEVALKRKARERGLFVMGPDCGTAIIGGVPLGFANVVPQGDIGIIGASGTGIQEVSCLIARAGRGISHAIGTGGRDLKAEVGAITTLMAIDALDADDRTKHVVLISKPPAASVARSVLDRVAKSPKPFTICFLGASDVALPANARAAATLKATAELVVGASAASWAQQPLPGLGRAGLVRGLFAGGTLCSEAQIIFRQAGLAVMSNVPVPGASAIVRAPDGQVMTDHVMIDLGDDEFTRGRPHPMFEPGVRDAPLAEALADPRVGIILLDLVLGYGGHPDPAGHLAAFLAGRDRRAVIVASVTGTDADPQPRAAQIEVTCGGGCDRRGLQRGRNRSGDCGARPMTLFSEIEVVVPILRSGVLAREFCRRHARATIEAVFERSFYLRSGDEFICVGEPDIGNGPLTLIGHLGPVSALGLHPRRSAEVCDRQISDRQCRSADPGSK